MAYLLLKNTDMPADPSFSESALAVLRERYLQRDEAGQLVEDPAGMLERMAKTITVQARLFGEDVWFWEARFLERMERIEFLPNSPTLMNAGLPGGQLTACFVLPIEDNLDSIFTALTRMARIHQTGGGTGFSFSALRPREDRVRSTGGITSGPLSFMNLFDRTTAVIRQGGRRRGANMAVLRVDHPDIEAFADAKRTPGRLENFNLSVGITDSFFAALDSRMPFALRNPRTGRVTQAVDPVELFDAIVEAAWAVGDPGLLFIEEINRHNPTPLLGTIEATNPCGEQPLLPYESCTLGSINLAAFATNNGVDWERLGSTISDAVVFLDNVIEANCYPFPAFHESVWPGRGFTALRNATVTCVVPTGTISLIAGSSAGIEPFFALAVAHRVLDGKLFVETNLRVAEALAPLGGPGESALQTIQERGSIRGIPGLPEEMRRRFPIALDIAPEFHVRMQAVFQDHVDTAVSKTVNLPPDAPRESVREVFLLARRLRLRGITVYRYGSGPGQTLSLVHEAARPDCRECAV